jgi:hypothetical protein
MAVRVRSVASSRRSALEESLRASGRWCGHQGPWQVHDETYVDSTHHSLFSDARLSYYERLAIAGRAWLCCVPCHQREHRFVFVVPVRVVGQVTSSGDMTDNATGGSVVTLPSVMNSAA